MKILFDDFQLVHHSVSQWRVDYFFSLHFGLSFKNIPLHRHTSSIYVILFTGYFFVCLSLSLFTDFLLYPFAKSTLNKPSFRKAGLGTRIRPWRKTGSDRGEKPDSTVEKNRIRQWRKTGFDRGEKPDSTGKKNGIRIRPFKTAGIWIQAKEIHS